MSPGSYDLDVAFVPDAATPGPAPDSAGMARDFAMTLRAAVTAGPGDVILVSADENGRLYA